MAESLTYSSLKSDIETYAERGDAPFVSQIPRFIMLAENRIASEVRGLGYLRFVNGNLVAGTPVLVKPARWRETGCLSVVLPATSEVKFLTQRSYTFCRSFWPRQAQTDVPKHYGDYDYEHYVIVPTPADNYEFELGFFERPDPLDDTRQTNWTTQYAPQLLLYATLLEAQPWLKLTERIAEFQALYDRAKAAVEMEAQRRLTGDQSMTRTAA